MLGNIEIGWLCVLGLLSAILFLIINRLKFDSYSKLAVYLFLFGFFMYSGIGICYDTVNKQYLIQYFLFALFFCIAFKYSGRRIKYFPIKEHKHIFQPECYLFCTFLYWAILLIKLVYPINRIPYLLHPTVSLVGIFSNTNSSPLVSLLNTVMTMIRPAYYIYLHEKASSKKLVVLLFLEMYLSLVIGGYVARSALIAQVIFVGLSVASKKTERMKQLVNENKELFNRLKKMLIALFILFLLSMPILYEYEYKRLGASISGNLNIYDKVDRLMRSEFSFPMNYSFCSDMHNASYFIRYLIYIVTLPIPSQLISIPNRLLLNQEFSIALLGLFYGEEGFYIKLPSLLGEGIIMFGDYFAFLLGGVIGAVLGPIFSYYEKYKEFRVWTLYLCILILLMCRGGSQSAIAIFINGSVLVVLLSFFDKYRFTFKR